MLFCSNCGSKAEGSTKFCINCGADMTAPSPPPPPPVIQPAPIPQPVPVPVAPSKKEQPAAVTRVSPVLKPIFYAVTAVLVVALIALGVFYGQGVGKLNKANTRINGLTTSITSLEGQLAAEKASVTSLQTQLATEKTNVAGLQTQLALAKSDIAASQAKVSSLTSDLASVNAKVTSLTADLSTANGKVTGLTADLATANGKVASTQASLDKANADLTKANADLVVARANNTSLQTQLTAIQAKYPLKDFPDYATFTTWVKAHIQLPVTTTVGPWYTHALKVQLLAAEDGYYISACIAPSSMTSSGYAEVYNTALVGGNTLYSFDPEIGTVFVMGTLSR